MPCAPCGRKAGDLVTVECPRCVVRGQSGARWHATGRRNTNKHQRRRAELVCDVCGYAFSSSLPAAMEAAEAISGPDDGQPPTVAPPPAPIPQPSLPGTRVLRQGNLTPVGSMAKDWKQRAYGDDE